VRERLVFLALHPFDRDHPNLFGEIELGPSRLEYFALALTSEQQQPIGVAEWIAEPSRDAPCRT
jgi:hypothetical protein